MKRMAAPSPLKLVYRKEPFYSRQMSFLRTYSPPYSDVSTITSVDGITINAPLQEFPLQLKCVRWVDQLTSAN